MDAVLGLADRRRGKEGGVLTGTGDLLDCIVEGLPPEEEMEEEEDEGIPRIAIVGRPNVGKSSLLNAILGTQRAIVSDVPGTTRDTIDTELEFQEHKLRLIDTAGIRRRGRVGPGVEKYSVLRSNRAIERCDVALLLIDASEGLAAQDTHIAGTIHEMGKGVIVIVNKWDLAQEQRRALRDAVAADGEVADRLAAEQGRRRKEPHRFRKHHFRVRQPGQIVERRQTAPEHRIDLVVQLGFDCWMLRQEVPGKGQRIRQRLVPGYEDRHALITHLRVLHATGPTLLVFRREQCGEEVAVVLA